jgi:hypothetical protein
LPDPATCTRITAEIRFPGEEPRKMSLFDWHGECLVADEDDIRYRNFWTHLTDDLIRHWKRKSGIVTDQATRLILMVDELGVILFSDERNVPHAAIPIDGGGYYCVAMDDSQFAEYIAHRFYLRDGRAPSSTSLNDCLRTIKGKARFEGEKRDLVLRVGESEGAFYYDMCDDKGRSVKITPDSWAVCQAPIIFRRFQHMIAQPEPAADGDGSLDRFVKMWHLASSDHEDMLKIMMGCMLVPRIPKTGLGLHGPPGSAKSLLTRAIKQIIDPSSITNQKIPGKEDELKRVLSKHHICTFDNVRNMTRGQADILCNAITGGATSSRALYTNDDDFTREIKTAIIVNGVNLEITEPDLLDRFYTLEMNVIPKELRRAEGEVLEEIERLTPGVLSDLFGYLSKAMRIKLDVEVKERPRMADWYEWAICFAEAMGMGREHFERMFKASQERQNEFAIENDPVATVLVSYVQSLTEPPYFAGTTRQLLGKLEDHAREINVKTNARDWPSNYSELGKRISKVKKNLASDEIWIYDCTWRDLRGTRIRTESGGMYRPEDRIKIVTRDQEPFKQVQNTRVDDPNRWEKKSQSQNQNRQTGQTDKTPIF